MVSTISVKMFSFYRLWPLNDAWPYVQGFMCVEYFNMVCVEFGLHILSCVTLVSLSIGPK
jgi:hypothetical protein